MEERRGEGTSYLSCALDVLDMAADKGWVLVVGRHFPRCCDIGSGIG